jgi:hypothetical protein
MRLPVSTNASPPPFVYRSPLRYLNRRQWALALRGRLPTDHRSIASLAPIPAVRWTAMEPQPAAGVPSQRARGDPHRPPPHLFGGHGQMWHFLPQLGFPSVEGRFTQPIAVAEAGRRNWSSCPEADPHKGSRDRPSRVDTGPSARRERTTRMRPIAVIPVKPM